MRISNETKIGALTAVSIALLILGFNFLKGKNLFAKGHIIYAKYKDTKGLMPSYPVMINGFQVGSIQEIQEGDKYLRNIIVSIKLKEDYKIPVNSVAVIKNNPLATSSIDIVLGNSPAYLKNRDTVNTLDADAGMFGELTSKIGPVADQLQLTLKSLDSVLKNVNTVFDLGTKTNLQKIVANLALVSNSLVTSASSLNALLDPKNGSLSKTANNLNAITGTVNANSFHLVSALENMDKASKGLAEADIKGTIGKLNGTADQLNLAIKKLNSNEGSMGALLNDKTLYNNLNSSARSLNILMDDIRANPKRYVSLNFSLIGGKKKNEPYITAPLMDTVKPVKK
ncbi:MAG: hypothetical protein JWN76_3591 [Chitinophagaceae bacterium]|nr:hypothetical protein [Chitinophagaceae bacterium]